MLSRTLPASVLFFSSVLAGCDNAEHKPELIELRGSTMGTGYSVLGYASDSVSDEQLQRRIDSLLEQINDQMSTYRPESEVSRFNGYPGTDWFEVSSETAYVVKQALTVSRASGGAFDVTVQPLVSLWGFGSEDARGEVPEQEEILAAAGHVGFEKIGVRMSPPAIKKDHSSMRIDLSGIAKGYAVDRIAEFLDGEAIETYLVEIGGELRARGRKLDGSPWKVAVERPLAGRRSVQQIMRLEDAAVATSGDYRNYFEEQGRQYSHILDPRRGRPAAAPLASVTIVARTATYADAMATALMVLGPSAGFEFAVEHNLAAFFLIRSDNGLEERATPRFEPLLLAVD